MISRTDSSDPLDIMVAIGSLWMPSRQLAKKHWRVVALQELFKNNKTALEAEALHEEDVRKKFGLSTSPDKERFP